MNQISSLYVLDNFRLISGLKLNRKKHFRLAPVPERELKWTKGRVKTLGVWLSTSPEVTTELNYSEKLEKLNTDLSCWNYRRLTRFWQNYCAEEFNCISTRLYSFPAAIKSSCLELEEINSLFHDFLWNGKSDKMMRDVMINDHANDGLNMIDINPFSKGLKTTWVRKNIDDKNHGKWKLFLLRTSELR